MASAQSIATARATQAELARQLGVSRQAINDLVKRRVLDVGQDGRIDVEMARVALANRVRPSSKTAAALTSPTAPAIAVPAPPAAPSAPDTVTSYHVAKTLREAAEAKIAQLKLSEMQGQLVRAETVRAETARLAAALRESILQLPARLTPVLAAESDPAKLHDLLERELHQVLAQLTQPQAAAAPAPA